MRNLLPDLVAAQKDASRVPDLRVVISDRIGGVRRLALERLYAGSEADNEHTVAIPTDGSLNRFRIDGTTLYRDRVASPDENSDYTNWTSFRTSTRNVAVATYGATILAFAVEDSDPRKIYWATSTDNGATWGAWALLHTATANIAHIAAASKSNGDTLILHSGGQAIRAHKRVGGTWSDKGVWTNFADTITGVDCYYFNDFNIALTGTEETTTEPAVWSMIYGDGYSQALDTWSPLREVGRASAGSGVSFLAPFLTQPDVYRLTFVEKYSGSQAYSRPLHTYSPPGADFVSNLWREPVPLNLSSDFGLAIAFSGDTAWLSSPNGVWRADLDVPTQDVTADVMAVEAEERPFDGRLRLTMRNDDGRYNVLPAAIKLGAEVAVSPGYVTASGPQASDGPRFWIEAIEHTSGGGEAALVLHARDAWALLSAWRARRQYAWAAGERNVFQILSFVFARAGLDFASVGSSAGTSDLYPAFAIYPGQSALAAVRRLLALLPDAVFFRAGRGLLKEPQAGEASGYAYGGDHSLLSGRYGSALPEANRVQLFGDGVFQERFDWASVESVYDRLLQVHDLNLTSVALADDRGDAELRRQAIASTTGEVVVPVNCGQELYDVVDITDAAAGLAAADRRILGIHLRYVAGGPRPLYQQRLTLGGV
jgi:hypothetical protein